MVVAAIGAAHAADMPGLPPPAVAVPLADVGTGWYLRGDVGYAWNQIDRAVTVPGFVDPTGNQWASGGVLGGGAGIRMYRLRLDATLDFAPATAYQGTSLRLGDVTARIAATTALFNAYLDITTWRAVTPYVGAGVGASYLTVSDFVSTAVPPFSPTGDHSRWSTTWALMGGISYAVSPTVLVDLGYRYLHVGSAETGADAVGSLSLNNLTSQQIRLGARWLFNDVIPMP
jgi:opacity protein-like surface antigen